ncbi:MAG: hypothetical protein Kow0069_00120 [Promethearchaeota archaeon]
MAYFDEKKRDADVEKKRKKLQKKAKRKQKEYDKKRKAAEMIKDEGYVQRELARQTMKMERARKKRDAEIQDTIAKVGGPGESFQCEVCGSQVEWDNLTCPSCGQLYCQYCGAPMDMENPAVCPRCQGVQNYTPAPMVITTVEQIPEEERFWEQLPECPKCNASVQPDWDECPLCGAKLAGKGAAPEKLPTAGPKKERAATVAKEPAKKKRRGL